MLIGRSGNPVGVICPGRNGTISSSSSDSSTTCGCLVGSSSELSVSLGRSSSLSCAAVAGEGFLRLGSRILLSWFVFEIILVVPVCGCVELVILFDAGVTLSSFAVCSTVDYCFCPVLLSLSLDLLRVDRLWVRITLGRVPVSSS